MPTPKTKSIPLLLLSLAALVLIVWLVLRPAGPVPLSTATPGTASSKLSTSSNAASATGRATDQSNGGLENVRNALLGEANAQINRQTLAELRQRLSSMPKNEAVPAIRRYLDSKADASTHLGFKLASNGTLDDAPTLRTFLLDELGRLDPAAAAEYSKTVLASADSADEWAIALRNLALGDSSPDGRALLQQKMTELLQNAAWQQNPSTGYLEAFDVAVYLGGTNFVPALSSLVRSQDNPAVAHAAFLAMDRLVINNPATVLASLQNSPELMQGREQTRADYFARADVSDPQQRNLLQNYLLDPSISAAELKAFAGIFPNANYMISANLLTQSATPDRDTLTGRDAQSLALAQQWLADPRFGRVAPELQTVIKRLEDFAAQTKGSQ